MKTLPIVLAAVLALAGPAVLADRDHDRARELKEAGDILPLETILRNARAVHPGKVIETEFEQHRGGYVYEIELVDDAGVVWKMKFDAKSGKLLQSKRSD